MNNCTTVRRDPRQGAIAVMIQEALTDIPHTPLQFGRVIKGQMACSFLVPHTEGSISQVAILIESAFCGDVHLIGIQGGQWDIDYLIVLNINTLASLQQERLL